MVERNPEDTLKMWAGVIFYIRVKINANSDPLHCFVAEKRSDEVTSYAFLRTHQHEKHLSDLFKLPIVMSAVKNLTEVGQYRNLR